MNAGEKIIEDAFRLRNDPRFRGRVIGSDHKRNVRHYMNIGYNVFEAEMKSKERLTWKGYDSEEVERNAKLPFFYS